MSYSEEMGNGLDTPITARGNYVNDINALQRWFHALIPTPSRPTRISPFTGTSIDTGDYRMNKPWVFVDHVAVGRSSPIGVALARERWQTWMQNYIKDNLYKY